MLPRLTCFNPGDTAEEVAVQDSVIASQTSQLDASIGPVNAWKQKRLTLGFSGGGFLLPYHLGVYQSLAIMGIADPNMPMAGSSAGSLVVASIKAGLSLQQQIDSLFEVTRDCQQHGVIGRLRSVLKGQLQKMMPADAAVRCSDGTCWISITQVMPRPANKLYGGFDNNKALIKALLASCHLPRISDGGLFTSYKSFHKRVFDGGFTNLVPVPPAPPPNFAANTTAAAAAEVSSGVLADGSSNLSSVSLSKPYKHTGTAVAFAQEAAVESESSTVAGAAAAGAHALRASTTTKGIRVRFGHRGSNHHPHQHHLQLRIGSHSSKTYSSNGHSLSSSSSKLFGRSKSAPDSVHAAAAAAATASSAAAAAAVPAADCCQVDATGAYVAPASSGWFAIRVCVVPAKHMSDLPAMLNAPTAEGVAIAPDKFQDWPHNLDATTKLALYPVDDNFLWDLFERGRADAVSWAREVGFPEVVLQKAEGISSDSSSLPDDLRVVRQQQQQGQEGMGDKLSSAGQQQQQQETVSVAAVGDAQARAAVAAAAAAGGTRA